MSTFNDRDTRNAICVANQPHAKPVLEFKESISTVFVEKRSLQYDYDEEYYQCEHAQTSPSERCRLHNIRLRRLILPALLVLLALGGLLVVNWHGWSASVGVDSLVGRDVNGTTASGNATTSGNEPTSWNATTSESGNEPTCWNPPCENQPTCWNPPCQNEPTCWNPPCENPQHSALWNFRHDLLKFSITLGFGCAFVLGVLILFTARFCKWAFETCYCLPCWVLNQCRCTPQICLACPGGCCNCLCDGLGHLDKCCLGCACLGG